MSLKEKLIAIRDAIKESKTVCFVNPDNEFDVELEDHEVGNQNIYRLYYINYHRIGMLGHSDNRSNIGLVNWPCKPFMLPEGLSREDGFRVLSYLTDFIEKRDDVEPGSLKSVNTLDSVLNNERFGFKRVDETDENKILNLFTIDGRALLFKRSELYKKYFEWYVEGVTKEEVENIYNKIGMEFRDIVWLDKLQDKVTDKTYLTNSGKDIRDSKMQGTFEVNISEHNQRVADKRIELAEKLDADIATRWTSYYAKTLKK